MELTQEQREKLKQFDDWRRNWLYAAYLKLSPKTGLITMFVLGIGGFILGRL